MKGVVILYTFLLSGTADELRRVSAVPSGLEILETRVPNVETLGYSQPSLRDVVDEILAALDKRVRAPITCTS